MTEVIVGTPLNNYSFSKAHFFADGISIRKLSPILWGTCMKSFVSDHQRDYLNGAEYWLCATREVDNAYGDGDELFDKARSAASALQIICPKGGRNIFLKFQKISGGFDILGVDDRGTLCSMLVGRIIDSEQQGLAQDFESIHAGVVRAFAEKIERLQHPILLLEQGMKVAHVDLAAMMFVIGLDVLFMAGDSDTFLRRVGGFLDLGSFLFPRGSRRDLQPSTCVRDVLRDAYEFRNFVAHGRELPVDPFRKKIHLVSTTGEQIDSDGLGYDQLLLDSALFMLTKALRLIFTKGLFDELADEGRWRRQMTLFEHRYKNSGGLVSAKKRGR